MPLRDATPVGAPCWVDVFTSEPEKAQAFYCDLFGWTVESAGPEYGGYFNFSKDGVKVAGGMVNASDGARPDFWTVYLAVADAQATLDAAAAHGGEIVVAAMPVGELGTMGMVTDPGGAAVGIWQPGEHLGFGAVGEPGTPSWFELHTRDHDACVAFYRDVFGWDTHVQGDTPEFRYTTLGSGDDQAAGIMDASGFLPEGEPSTWSIYFGVDDTDAALAKIVDLGGTVVIPAEETPYGRLAAAADPTGTRFKLVAG